MHPWNQWEKWWLRKQIGYSNMHTNWTFTPEKIPSPKMRLTLSVLEELDTKPTVEESLTSYHVWKRGEWGRYTTWENPTRKACFTGSITLAFVCLLRRREGTTILPIYKIRLTKMIIGHRGQRLCWNGLN